jgi:hypothetical protein
MVCVPVPLLSKQKVGVLFAIIRGLRSGAPKGKQLNITTQNLNELKKGHHCTDL